MGQTHQHRVEEKKVEEVAGRIHLTHRHRVVEKVAEVEKVEGVCRIH